MAAIEFTLFQLAEITESKLVGDGNLVISGVGELSCAESSDASFLANPKYKELVSKTKAGVVCIDHETPQIDGKNYLVSDSPSKSFQTIINAFLKAKQSTQGFSGIHPTAVIHDSAKLEENVTVMPYVVIDANATVAKGTTIHSHSLIGPGVRIGKECVIHPHVTIREDTHIGDRVIIQPGAVIGSCGFGYLTDDEGLHAKLSHLGNVILEDDVEVGANTTIDRARFKSTVISKGSKVDNLVQIGHNVVLGEGNIIVSQTGISGSVKTGKHVIMGGQAGISGHVKLGDGVKIAAKTGVSKSIQDEGVYRGVPATSISKFNRHQAQLRKIGAYVSRIEELEDTIAKLQEQLEKKS